MICPVDYVWLSLAGVVAGVLGGLLGIGGSSIMLPAMVLILGAVKDGVEQIHQYQAAAMMVNFLLIVPSVAAHARKRAIWKGVWAYMAPAALVGIILGVQASWLFEGAGAEYLRWGVGVFFMYVVGHNVYRLAHARPTESLPRERVEQMPAWRKIAVGLPMGAVAGLLGIGGGSLAVPAQQIALKMPLRNAIATSAATIASVSWAGAIFKNAQLGPNGTVERSLLLAACLAPTAMIGSYLGGHLTHALPVRVVRAAFAALMVFAAIKMFGWI